jgi:hypothetical protein
VFGHVDSRQKRARKKACPPRWTSGKRPYAPDEGTGCHRPHFAPSRSRFSLHSGARSFIRRTKCERLGRGLRLRPERTHPTAPLLPPVQHARSAKPMTGLPRTTNRYESPSSTRTEFY